MIQLNYLRSRFRELLLQFPKNPIAKLFLSDADIAFLGENQCLISVSTNDCLEGQYTIEFNRESILKLCNC